MAATRSTAAPKKHLAVVTCMDARIDVFKSLGIDLGDAHIIRNAGGLVTPDVLRSLTLSQRRLGTTSVIVIQHTDCGLLNLDEKALMKEISGAGAGKPPFVFGSFTDLDASVRQGVQMLRASKFLLHRSDVRGYVYEVETGKLRPVQELQVDSLVR